MQIQRYCFGSGVEGKFPGLGFGVWGLGLGVRGLGFGVWGVECGVWGVGFGGCGAGFGVWGVGFWADLTRVPGS